MVGGEAGEFCALAHAERQRLLEFVMREANGLPVYVNVAANTTSGAMALAQDAKEWGVAGAVLMPPVAPALTADETKFLIQAVRRHGQVPVGFLDPTGKHASLASEAEQPGIVTPKRLADKNLEAWMIGHGSADECWTPAGIVHPIGLFGAARAGHLWSAWAQFGQVLTGLFRLGGTARIGKYLAEAAGVDVGPPRPPLDRLATDSAAVVDQIIAKLDSAQSA